MRVVCISDLHGKLPEVQNCDLLLIAGDVTPIADHSLAFQRTWLDTTFRRWLQAIPAKRVCAVAGNHDFIFEKDPGSVPTGLRWDYLLDSGVEFDGLKIWGTPWQPWFMDWAFNSPKQDAEIFLARKFAAIPAGTDILISHGAPYGIGDVAPTEASRTPQHVGSTALLERIKQVCPALVVFGHLHGGYGVYSMDCGGRDMTLANASVLDEGYDLKNPPIMFDISRQGGQGGQEGAVRVSRVD